MLKRLFMFKKMYKTVKILKKEKLWPGWALTEFSFNLNFKFNIRYFKKNKLKKPLMDVYIFIIQNKKKERKENNRQQNDIVIPLVFTDTHWNSNFSQMKCQCWRQGDKKQGFRDINGLINVFRKKREEKKTPIPTL